MRLGRGLRSSSEPILVVARQIVPVLELLTIESDNEPLALPEFAFAVIASDSAGLPDRFIIVRRGNEFRGRDHADGIETIDSVIVRGGHHAMPICSFDGAVTQLRNRPLRQGNCH